jgi:plastocyanin
MRSINNRLSALFVTASLAALVAIGCGGTTSGTDAKNDGKIDGKVDAGTGGKTGTGGSGTGGSGTGGSNIDAQPSDPGIKEDFPAIDVKPDLAPDVVDAPADTADVPRDVAPDAGTDAVDAPAETTPETATETATETAPDAAAFTVIAPCNAAGDYMTDSSITFPANGNNPQQYSPACVKIAKNATVTFTGGFNSHPLQPRDPVPAGATSGNPIVHTSGNQASAMFQFPNAGFFPFECDNHPGTMRGVIWVTE